MSEDCTFILCLHMVFCCIEWVSTLICTNVLELIMVRVFQGDKNIIKFEGDHNSPRPQFYYDSITIFFYNVLQPSEAPLAVEAPEAIYFDDALDIDDVDEVCVSWPLPFHLLVLPMKFMSAEIELKVQ